jgi:hypothetical protein
LTSLPSAHRRPTEKDWPSIPIARVTQGVKGPARCLSAVPPCEHGDTVYPIS